MTNVLLSHMRIIHFYRVIRPKTIVTSPCLIDEAYTGMSNNLNSHEDNLVMSQSVD